MAYTVKINRNMAVAWIKSANLSNSNNIFDIPNMPNLDRSLVTLEELRAHNGATVCPVGAVFLEVLPPSMTLEAAEDFVSGAVCGGLMQGPKALRSQNAFSRLSAFYEDGDLASKEAIVSYVNRTFPTSFELTLE